MWHYTTPNTIWKILPDTDLNLLVVEKRNLEQQQVFFDILDVQSEKKLVENLIVWENWWVSVAAIACNHLVLVLYEQDNGLANKGLIVYDIKQQQIAWQNTQLNFYNIDTQNNCVWLREHLESPVLKPYDLATGDFIQKNIQFFHQPPTYQLPYTYTPENPYFGDLKEFIELKTSKNVYDFVTYLENKEYIYMVYNTEIEEKFAYFSLIVDIAGNVKIRQQIFEYQNTQESYIAWNNFFVVYPNPKELHIYSLA